MPGFALNGDAARLLNLLDSVPGQARVVDDLTAGVLLEQHFSQQADKVIALNEPTIGIEEEAAIEVTVPGQAHVALIG
ncbi:hypothetical protein D3C81_2232620 [compost metagenome]